MDYYSAIKRSEIGSFVETWIDLESVIQNKVSQKEKNKYHTPGAIVSITHFMCSNLLTIISKCIEKKTKHVVQINATD